MIKQNLQNLVHSSNLIPNQLNGPQYLLGTGDAGLFTRAISGLRNYLAESSRQQVLEAQIRKAIEHLHTLTDEQLRDMGITRTGISRAVRYGRENI